MSSRMIKPIYPQTRPMLLYESTNDYNVGTLADAFTSLANDAVKEQMSIRLAKLKHLESELGSSGYPEIDSKETESMTTVEQINKNHRTLNNDEENEGVNYCIYGRIKAIRFGGLFVVIEDKQGDELQVLFRRKMTIHIGDKPFNAENIDQLIDIGDVIQVGGHVKKTGTGELTLIPHHMSILAKCLLPMPDGFHGLKDVATRHKLRHLDIMVNEDTRGILLQRSHIIWELRKLLHSKGFVEVETPILQHIYSGANAQPFKTRSEALDENLYLRIAPEFFLKRLIVGGLGDKIFEIGKCFRNEGTSARHSPEFTMIEIYQQMANAGDMINLLEEIIETLAKKIGVEFPKFTRKTMVGLIEEHIGINVDLCSSEQLLSILRERGLDTNTLESNSWGSLVATLFKCAVEDNITEPTHVTELPSDISPLAASEGSKGKVFESYLQGLEIAHGCTEECNPVQLLHKLDMCGLQGLGHTRDTELLNAVAHGMPPTAGIGIGIDRLVMALSKTTSIKNIQTFPLLKSEA
ncbi:putative lysyl-tRNA synthetase [Babesia bovis T2Bo]|uniref:Lysyl-tRNA synthetase n=1 Tax=Babesia bovis TaxID=5865 RepID=A7AT14_BABBO|nr:putative lysyl-tRNA synthetase [Babesia bovis T2Bo]EDO06075.1 putative lysyl-tRNA synthetase [Babesia bovis T2Bo]|eukprot:XP_001609643.1 lysyl-tRNA synthetase [Babesia bovis T2Bo]